MNAASVDIAIVGGGHAGLLLAAALAGTGWSLTVLEPTSAQAIRSAPVDGRTLALLAGSQQILDRHGVQADLAAVASPIWTTDVLDRAGDARILYDAKAELGHPFGYGVENRLLRHALLDAVERKCGTATLRSDRVVAIARERDAVRLGLGTSAELHARLVIGADGRGSRVRELAAIGLDRWAYHQSALAFVIAHERHHHHAVRERLRPGGPLATLPLPGRRSGVTWVEPHERAQELRSMPALQLLSLLEQELGDIYGRMVIEGPLGLWPLSAQHTRRYVAPRLALVGDAAHGSHPIHAQGFNMGVGDVGALARLLEQAATRGRGDPGAPELLLAYERERRPENSRRLLLTDGLNRLFSNDSSALATIRGLGLRALDSATPLKRMVIRHGMQLA